MAVLKSWLSVLRSEASLTLNQVVIGPASPLNALVMAVPISGTSPPRLVPACWSPLSRLVATGPVGSATPRRDSHHGGGVGFGAVMFLLSASARPCHPRGCYRPMHHLMYPWM